MLFCLTIPEATLGEEGRPSAERTHYTNYSLSAQARRVGDGGRVFANSSHAPEMDYRIRSCCPVGVDYDDAADTSTEVEVGSWLQLVI